MTYYEGRGEHSVNRLEKMVEERNERLIDVISAAMAVRNSQRVHLKDKSNIDKARIVAQNLEELFKTLERAE